MSGDTREEDQGGASHHGAYLSMAGEMSYSDYLALDQVLSPSIR